MYYVIGMLSLGAGQLLLARNY